MPSRMDLRWDEASGNQKGALQGVQLYMRAAGVYQNILEEIESIKNIAKMRGKEADQNSFWKVFKKLMATDLHKKTLKMLQNVMQAQALYLIYNNIQQKHQRNHISDPNGDLSWHQCGITV